MSDAPRLPLPGERVTDLARLDRKLADIAASPRGPAAHFGEFWFDMPMPEGLDPFSPAYRAAVLAQYRRLTGRDYSTDHEAHPFDVGTDHDFSVRPWPFNTGDAEQVGNALLAVGFVISTCRPRRGHRILEMGAGWGNLALPLAQMDCSVTALDTEERYLRIIRNRADRGGLRIRTVQAGFLNAAQALGDDRFDLVMFHAAFHHCDDHLVLLRLIHQHLLAPGGRLVLAGEPLLEDLPYPWGLNPMGEGIWAIRTFGWHELVFRPSYLIQALAATGYEAVLTTCPLTAMGNVIIAHRRPADGGAHRRRSRASEENSGGMVTTGSIAEDTGTCDA